MSAATIIVNNNGTINLVTGSVDIGGTRTAVAMQAAEVLGIAAEDVIPTVVDTDTIGYTAVTGGSRTAFDTGSGRHPGRRGRQAADGALGPPPSGKCRKTT